MYRLSRRLYRLASLCAALSEDENGDCQKSAVGDLRWLKFGVVGGDTRGLSNGGLPSGLFGRTHVSGATAEKLSSAVAYVLHAIITFPAQIKWVTKAVRKTAIRLLCQLFFADKAGKTENNRLLGQRLRRFIEKVTHLAGEDNGQRVRRWIARKKAGWYVLNEDASIPKTSTPLDQIHNALDRKLFMMKGFHHSDGSQRVFLNSFAILANLIPYQRRAINGGKCAIEVEGGKVPTRDWSLNLQILTSGGFQ